MSDPVSQDCNEVLSLVDRVGRQMFVFIISATSHNLAWFSLADYWDGINYGCKTEQRRLFHD